MALSDLSKPTYINQLTSLDLKNPLSWVSIILAVAGIAIVALMFLVPNLGDTARLVLAVTFFAIIWAETYLMRRLQASRQNAEDSSR